MAKVVKITQPKPGKISIKDLKKSMNKAMGIEAAYDLTQESPTEVKEWIPTGSRWLDSIIAKGKMGGIPVGKITALSQLEELIAPSETREWFEENPNSANKHIKNETVI